MTGKPVFNILSLDGGGSKGVYTLGVLAELEASLQRPLWEHFDLIYGASTGSIIATLLAMGSDVSDVLGHYHRLAPAIMSKRRRGARSRRLREEAKNILGEADFSNLKTDLGVVTTDAKTQRPRVFKSSVEQAIGRQSTFEPGFGLPLRDAVIASCSAVPFFQRTSISTAVHGSTELLDGGFVANNPSLFAISDAVSGFGIRTEDIRLLSVGTGNFAQPRYPFWKRWVLGLPPVAFLQLVLNANANSMGKLVELLFPELRHLRICDSFSDEESATDLFEHDRETLNHLERLGRESYGQWETAVQELFAP